MPTKTIDVKGLDHDKNHGLIFPGGGADGAPAGAPSGSFTPKRASVPL